jgi:predicted transcriptional regulator
MEKLNPPVDKKKYYEIPKGLSEYERNKVKYTPTHFTFTKVEEGRLKGFDKVNKGYEKSKIDRRDHI